MSLKLKAPEGFGGFSYQGTPVDVPKDGMVDAAGLPTDMISVMKSHGFTEVLVEESKKTRKVAE